MKKRTTRRIIFFAASIFSAFFTTNTLFAQEKSVPYPEISDLNSRNVVFKQYQEQIEAANKALFLERNIESHIAFYYYEANKNDTVMTIYSRCAIRYDTLVTLNRIESKDAPLEGKKLILPTVNGLYIPETPANNIEILISEKYASKIESGQLLKLSINNRTFYFIPNEKFSPTERAFYLEPELRLPLDKSVLTSAFGMRVSPISGKWLFHKGIDMAAPQGTPIFACKSGTVTHVGVMDPTYGNYVIIDHGKGMTSFYAHMKEILVNKNSTVLCGEKIGLVGVTGQVTGPHLHFEIRMNGEAQDPQKYIQKL